MVLQIKCWRRHFCCLDCVHGPCFYVFVSHRSLMEVVLVECLTGWVQDFAPGDQCPCSVSPVCSGLGCWNTWSRSRWDGKHVPSCASSQSQPFELSNQDHHLYLTFANCFDCPKHNHENVNHAFIATGYYFRKTNKICCQLLFDQYEHFATLPVRSLKF